MENSTQFSKHPEEGFSLSQPQPVEPQPNK